jgi:hypothetical protein
VWPLCVRPTCNYDAYVFHSPDLRQTTVDIDHDRGQSSKGAVMTKPWCVYDLQRRDVGCPAFHPRLITSLDAERELRVLDGLPSLDGDNSEG